MRENYGSSYKKCNIKPVFRLIYKLTSFAFPSASCAAPGNVLGAQEIPERLHHFFNVLLILHRSVLFPDDEVVLVTGIRRSSSSP